jgi:hypothetical protein
MRAVELIITTKPRTEQRDRDPVITAHGLGLVRGFPHFGAISSEGYAVPYSRHLT